MIGYGGEYVSIVPFVYPRWTVSVSSLVYFSSVGSFYKPSHPSLPVSIRALHIQEYFKNKRGRKRKSIKPHKEKARNEEWMKQSKVIVREKLVVGCWELITMESGAELLAPQDIATVIVSEERPPTNKQNNYRRKEDNWPRLKKHLAKSWYPSLRGKCYEACLELGLDKFPKQTVLNILQRIVSNPITYDNDFPMKKRELILENEVNYVEDIITKRDTSNFGLSRKEVIQVISDLGQAKLFIQAENNLDYLIRSKWMTYLKRLWRVVEAQATTT